MKMSIKLLLGVAVVFLATQQADSILLDALPNIVSNLNSGLTLIPSIVAVFGSLQSALSGIFSIVVKLLALPIKIVIGCLGSLIGGITSSALVTEVGAALASIGALIPKVLSGTLPIAELLTLAPTVLAKLPAAILSFPAAISQALATCSAPK